MPLLAQVELEQRALGEFDVVVKLSDVMLELDVDLVFRGHGITTIPKRGTFPQESPRQLTGTSLSCEFLCETQNSVAWLDLGELRSDLGQLGFERLGVNGGS